MSRSSGWVWVGRRGFTFFNYQVQIERRMMFSKYGSNLFYRLNLHFSLFFPPFHFTYCMDAFLCADLSQLRLVLKIFGLWTLWKENVGLSSRPSVCISMKGGILSSFSVHVCGAVRRKKKNNKKLEWWDSHLWRWRCSNSSFIYGALQLHIVIPSERVFRIWDEKKKERIKNMSLYSVHFFVFIMLFSKFLKLSLESVVLL